MICRFGFIHADIGAVLNEKCCYIYTRKRRFRRRSRSFMWNIPTGILYGKKDDMTSLETITNFAHTINASLTIFDKGEHWFHTEEQMDFLDTWVKAAPGAFLLVQ